MTTHRTLIDLNRPAPAAARVFLHMLSHLRVGHLQVITPWGQVLLFGAGRDQPGAVLQINDWRACARILRGGDIGFAEALRDDWIHTPDLTALLRLAIRNESAVPRMVWGQRVATVWYRLKHWLRPNTRAGSRRNIHAHYDIGNPFYQLWLDETWTYSSALFRGDFSLNLADAQQAKYARIFSSLGLQAGQRVLEIGCGWGGFAEFAAQRGVHVHGITISPAQLAHAQQRISAAGLDEWVTLELCDYRDLRQQYDAVVSIEMFEAVGEQFWDGYFNVVQQRLVPGGRALIQSITIADDRFEQYRANTDFIQQFVFPGGMLPSPQRFVRHAQRCGLSVRDQLFFGRDYAETLRRWQQRFVARLDDVRGQGYDDAFIRIWRMYLSYCEAGFDEGRIDVAHFLLQRG